MLGALSDFVDQNSAIIGLLLLVLLLVGFVLERFPPVVVAVTGVALVVLLGFLGPTEMLGVFSNPAPITIAALFVLSGALVRVADGPRDAVLEKLAQGNKQP